MQFWGEIGKLTTFTGRYTIYTIPATSPTLFVHPKVRDMVYLEPEKVDSEKVLWQQAKAPALTVSLYHA